MKVTKANYLVFLSNAPLAPEKLPWERERETYCVLMSWLRDILGTFHKKGDNKYHYFISQEMGKVVDSTEITYSNKLFMAVESLKYLNTITVFNISYLSL